MAELDSGVKRMLLAGSGTTSNRPKQEFQFVTEETKDTVSAKEVYFRWLSRLVFLCAVISLAFFLSATLVIFRLAPEIMVQPLLISKQSDSERMLRYEAMTNDMPSKKQLTEMFVRQYVIMRNTVINDEQEMRTRWGPGGIVNYMSAPDIYGQFIGLNEDSVEKMFDKGFSSEVKIDKLYKETENSPAWIVDFTVFNLSQGRASSGDLTLKIKRYKASVTPKFFEERGLIRARLINPTGFTVVKYSQDEIRE